MNNKTASITRGRYAPFYLLLLLFFLPAVALLGLSLAVLAAGVPDGGLSANTWLTRQAAAGVLALVGASLIGWFRLHRFFLRWWFLFPAVFLLVVVAAPFSVRAGWDVMISGTHWWQRSKGVVVALLALVACLSVALPRLASGGRGGAAAVAGCFLFAVGVPVFFLERMSQLAVFAGVALLPAPFVLRGRRLVLVFVGAVALFLSGSAAVLLPEPVRLDRVMSFMDERAVEGWQLMQSLVSVHAGGWTGGSGAVPRLPEWATDFTYGRLSFFGGAFAALGTLALVVFLAWLALRVALLQSEPRRRALAVACGAALAIPGLCHVAVNLGLVPTAGYAFPFLSYGPTFLLLNGLWVGLLVSLAREARGAAGDAPVSKERIHRDNGKARVSGRWPALACTGVLVMICGVSFLRTTSLIGSEWLAQVRADQELLVRERSGLGSALLRGPVLDCDGRTLAQTVSEGSLPRRFYAVPAPHVVGFVQKTGALRGLGGVEFAFEEELAAGAAVRLTLDARLQDQAQSVAASTLVETSAAQVWILVMNPRTGAIRAAAQAPAGSPEVRDGDPARLQWRAAIDVFEPGGWVGPLVVATALKQGALETDAMIDCAQGRWFFGSAPPVSDAVAHGELTPAGILRTGSNIGLARVGVLMGREDLHSAFKYWGFRHPCSAGLAASTLGILHEPEDWTDADLTRIPMGHGVAVSFLQIARAYTAFFNGGSMVEPYLVDAVREPGDSEWRLLPRTYPMGVLGEETAESVREMLEEVVASGTGKGADVGDLVVAGKTAVVRKVDAGTGEYSDDRFQTGFIGGFAAADGTPWLIAVWLDEPEREGHRNPAVSCFREVAERVVSGEVRIESE